MGNRKDYILNGMRLERKKKKVITRMVKKMDYGLGGMRMVRRDMKKLTRMGN